MLTKETNRPRAVTRSAALCGLVILISTPLSFNIISIGNFESNLSGFNRDPEVRGSSKFRPLGSGFNASLMRLFSAF
jgi:hypothetical protein